MKHLCAMFAVILISFPAFADERGQTSFALKILATEEPPLPVPKMCTFGSTANLAELSQATFDDPDSDVWHTITYPSFPLEMTIPSTTTKVVLGVAIEDQYGVDNMELHGQHFEDSNHRGLGYPLTPFYWNYGEDPSEYFEADTHARRNGVTLKSGWVTNTATTITIPSLRVGLPFYLAAKPKPSKERESNPVHITCYDD